MNEIVSKPIGTIRSPFVDIKDMPIQPKGAKGIKGTVEIEPEFEAGLKDIDGFSHIILIFHFHLSDGYALEVKPFLDDKLHGVFATRAPKRPNQIGMSIVKLNKADGSTLYIEDVDVVDGTPLLDIKPYVPKFEPEEQVRVGWLSKTAHFAGKARSDERFK